MKKTNEEDAIMLLKEISERIKITSFITENICVELEKINSKLETKTDTDVRNVADLLKVISDDTAVLYETDSLKED